ncbi:MAG: undecaprenyl-phosphate glucose phosphotransferase [Parvularculaceae bacterium]
MSSAPEFADPALAEAGPNDDVAGGARLRRPISRALYGDLIQFSDFALITAASIAVAYFYHQATIIVTLDFLQQYAAAGIIGATGLTALLRRDGYYDFDALISSSRAMRPVIARWALIILGLIAFAFALKVSEAFSRFWLFTWAGASAVALVSARLAAAAYLRRAAREGGVFDRRIAVVGFGEATERFVDQATNVELAISIVGVFTPGGPKADEPGRLPTEILRGDVASLERAARRGDVDDVLIALPNHDRAEMTTLINRLSDLPVSVAVLSSAHWLDHQGGEVVRIAGAPAMTLYRRPLEGWGGVLKTLEDRILGVVLFALALPLMALCALALRIQGSGPIFFRQQRHGFNHEVFRIYKFRTMTVAEDGAVVRQASAGDARVTPVGAFLRKWSLDELPQLINVLKGEMSLVGPRPHALAHNHEYAKAIENYSGRHKVKPGITGWAQVNGYRGETSETEQMANRVKFDLDYIDNWSLWFDAKILILTIAAVLFPKNAH